MNEESVDLNSSEFDDPTFVPSAEGKLKWQKNLIGRSILKGKIILGIFFLFDKPRLWK